MHFTVFLNIQASETFKYSYFARKCQIFFSQSIQAKSLFLFLFLFGLSRDFPEWTLMAMVHNGKASVTWKCWHGGVGLTSLMKLQF